MDLAKSHYCAFDAANIIFLKATKNTASRYINKLYELGELRTSTKIGMRWWISKEDVDRIKLLVWSGELIVRLPISEHNQIKRTK